VAGIDGNRGWSQINLGLEISLRSSLNVGESGEGGSNIGCGEGAGSVFSSVWVAGLSVNSVVADDVLHGLSHQTTIASLVSFAGGAINEVLFRNSDHLVLGQEVASFSRSSGGEGPAASALLLILDVRNSSLGSPIPLGGESSNLLWLVVVEGSLVNILSSQIDLGKFFGSEVSVFVHGDSEGLVGTGIVLVNEVQVALEDSVSVLELVMVVGLSILVHPEDEGRLVLSLSKGISDSEEESDSEQEQLELR